MKFNTQVCTTREQSERLLALGLKKETADCRWFGLVKDARGKDIPKKKQVWCIRVGESETAMICGFMRYSFIPAWSLHRLMVLADFAGTAFADLDSAYETCISIIESQIRLGIIKKDYLEETK